MTCRFPAIHALGCSRPSGFFLTTTEQLENCHHFSFFTSQVPSHLSLPNLHVPRPHRNHDIDDHGPQPKGGYNDIPPIQVRFVLQGNRINGPAPTNASCVLFGLSWKGVMWIHCLDTVTSLSPPAHCVHFLTNTFLFTETT